MMRMGKGRATRVVTHKVLPRGVLTTSSYALFSFAIRLSRKVIKETAISFAISQNLFLYLHT